MTRALSLMGPTGAIGDGVAVDVDGVREVGLDRWHDGFSWPIHPELFPAVCREMLGLYLSVARCARSDHRLVLLASFKVHIIFYQWVHMLLLADGAGRTGRHLKLHRKTLFTELLPNARAVEGSTCAWMLPVAPRSRQRLQSALWFGKRQIARGEILTAWRRLASEEVCIAFPHQYPICRRYCELRGADPVSVPLELLVGGTHLEVVPDWASLTEEIVEGYAGIIGRYCGVLSDRQRLTLQQYFHTCLDRYFGLFGATIAWLSRLPRVDSWVLLSSSLGSPIHKIVAQSVRHLGGRVVGMSHSNAFGRPNSYNVCANEMAICDEYVVGSAAEKEVFEYCIDHYGNLIPESAEIAHGRVTAVRDHYHLVHDGDSPFAEFPSTISTIMLVGAPYVPYQNYYFPGASGIHWLYLETGLIRRLRAEGFSVLYKPHPDRIEECRGFFDGRVDAVLDGRVEDIWKQADCLLNMSWGTTVYSFSLLTCRPCIVVDTAGAPWPPSVRSIVEQRCMVIGTVVDERDNSVRCREEDLAECISLLKDPQRIRARLEASHEAFLSLLK